MKIQNLNYRQPNVDRFLEIMSLVKFNHSYITVAVKNIPAKYEYMLNQLDVTLSNITESDFIIEYVQPTKLRFDLDKIESIDMVRDRINKTIEFIKSNDITNTITEASIVLLENAMNKLEIDVDKVYKILLVANYIALHERSKIEPVYIAEAISYSFLTSD